MIRNGVYSSISQPNGYIENIVRLRKANEEKKKLSKIKATQGVPKNYTGKNTAFQPFDLKTEAK